MNKKNLKYKLYGRLKGRKKISSAEIKDLKKNLFEYNNIISNQSIILDIGSGNGESSIYLAKKNPEKLIIASEVFKDGNIKLSNYIKKEKINNIKIFNKNILILFDYLSSKEVFKQIWILFPDPWPKKKHHKRRLVNKVFLKSAYSFLSKNGQIFISTDSISYFLSMLLIINKMKIFKWDNDKVYEWDYSQNKLFYTKYFKKSLNAKRKSFIIKLSKI